MDQSTDGPVERGIDEFFSEKSVLVTGACGTIGRHLIGRLARSPARSVMGTDNAESAVFELGRQYEESRVRIRLGDVQNREQLVERFRGIDVVIHTAAYKHVYTCEASPRDAVGVNVLGTQNVIDAARRAGVRHVLFTSSDKAVNPTSVMGTSKLLSERLIAAAAAQAESDGPIFTATRFGNVLGSSGSVVPIFARQIARGGPVSLTDHRMNRFVMSATEAVDLVLDSVRRSQGGEIFVTKMHSIRIPDLAAVMIDELAPRFRRSADTIDVQVTGARPGEKLYEELVSEEEGGRVIELEGFFVILPALSPTAAAQIAANYGIEAGSAGVDVYRSDVVEPLDRYGLRDYLRDTDVLEAAAAGTNA